MPDYGGMAAMLFIFYLIRRGWAADMASGFVAGVEQEFFGSGQVVGCVDAYGCLLYTSDAADE